MTKKSTLFLRMINELNDISGFLNVHKTKWKNLKGFKWVYSYVENGKRKFISNNFLFALKNEVISRNLPWEVTDYLQAQKSVDLEKSKYYLYDNGFGVLFLDLAEGEYNPFSGFWRYKYRKSEFYDLDLDNLKRKIERNNLPWIVLNEDNAKNSFKLDQNFQSGIFRVNKIRHGKFKGVFQWCYIYGDDCKCIVSEDLNSLKLMILKNDLEWIVTDEDNYNRALDENRINLKNIVHEKWAFSGIEHVKKTIKREIQQGFLWTYRFKHKGTVVDISSTDLTELKQKVLNQGFDWTVTDENIADLSFRENEINLAKFRFSKNKTGIYRVYKSKNKGTPQGFYWVYAYSADNIKTSFSSVNLLELKKKVLENGLE